MKLILASNSPRRKQLLSALVRDIVVEPSAFKEEGAALPARETALAFACGKAEEVFARRGTDAVLGADTVVALGDRILGKPKDKADAARMLRALSGKMHTVYTGVCLIEGGREETAYARAEVRLRKMSPEEIKQYVNGGSPMDKAGAYGVQDGVVQTFAGEYENIMGLPLETLAGMRLWKER